MSYQVIARKYRPQTFADVVGQEHITQTIRNAITANRLHHAYLLTGVRGVGKTTLARIFSKALNCEKGPAAEPCNKCPQCNDITAGTSMDVQEIDGASNTGVDDIREIRERVKYLPSGGRYKIYIIDEVHMLSTAAFNALLKTLEEPPAHVIFIFATTEPHKIPATILSRCQRYDFRRIAMPKIVETLSSIAKSEGISVDSESLGIIASEAEGSMRDAESLFDQAVAYAGKTLTYKHLKELLGFLDRKQINATLEAIIKKDARAATSMVEELFQTGANLVRFSTDLLEQFRNLLLIKACDGNAGAGIGLPSEEVNKLKELSESATIDECNQWFNLLYKGVEEISRTKFQRMVLDVLMINLTQVSKVKSVDDLIMRVEELKSLGIVLSQKKTEKSRGSTIAEFISWLNSNKPQISSILSHSISSRIDGNKIIVQFPKNSLYGDMLTETERKKIFEKTAKDFFNFDYKLTIEFKENGANEHQKRIEERKIVEEKRKATKEEALSHEVIREAANIFSAEIKEIKTK